MKHRAKNCISNLRIGDMSITEENDILKELVSFFASLMIADPNLDPLNQEEILSVIPSLVSREKTRCWELSLMIRKFFKLYAP